MILASYEPNLKKCGGGYARGDHIFVDPALGVEKRRIVAMHEVIETRWPDIPHEQIDPVVCDMVDALRQLELI
jgi:hypothetical protein